MSRLLGNALGAWAVWRAWRSRKATGLAALQGELNVLRSQRRDAATMALLYGRIDDDHPGVLRRALEALGVRDPEKWIAEAGDLHWNGTVWVRR